MGQGKEIAKVIGWTCFGITLTIMYFGMFSAMALSNIDSEIRTYHKIDMDNNTKDAIIGLSEMNTINCEFEELNLYSKYLEKGSLNRKDLTNN